MTTTIAPKVFTCVDCKKTKPIQPSGGTGYGTRPTKDKYGPAGKVCYTCCGKGDESYMEDEGKITLYLSLHKENSYTRNPLHSTRTDWKITNWPGSLEIQPRHISHSHHNMAGKWGRTDVWFTHNGRHWHGVNIGDNEILRCRRLKK